MRTAVFVVAMAVLAVAGAALVLATALSFSRDGGVPTAVLVVLAALTAAAGVGARCARPRRVGSP